MSVAAVGFLDGILPREDNLAGSRRLIFFRCGLGLMMAEANGRASWKAGGILETVDSSVSVFLSSLNLRPSEMS